MSKNSNDSEYLYSCESCGKEFKKESLAEKHETKCSARKNNIKKIIRYASLLIILFSVLALGYNFIPVKECQNNQIIESIDVDSEQKCLDIKCQNISIPYVEEQEYEYTFIFGIIEDKTLSDIETTPEGNLNYFTKQVTKIKNFDNKTGTFKVVHHYRTLKNEESKESSVSIGGGETKEIITSYDNAFGENIEVKTTVIAPTEIRKREKIKYKQVENCNYIID